MDDGAEMDKRSYEVLQALFKFYLSYNDTEISTVHDVNCSVGLDIVSN